MDPEEQGGAQTLETEQTEAGTDTNTEAQELTPEQIAELREKAAKADDLEKKNRQLFERAKKAEAHKPEPVSEQQLTVKDTLALVNAKIDPDDFDEVVSYAQYRKMPVADALKDATLRVILRERGQERQTAASTHTRGGTRGATKVTPDTVLQRASKGELPDDSDTDAMSMLVAARLQKKRSR